MKTTRRFFSPAKLASVTAVTAVALELPARADDAQSSSSTSTYRRPDVEITNETDAQFYEMRSPSGATVIPRRRLTTTLGAAAYDLLDKPSDPMAPTLTFRARVRYDADYGGSSEETSPASTSRFVPGYSRGPVDLMYAYVEGRRFLHGFLGFKLGRQYITDALGWWSFDGGDVKVTTPYYFAVEAYGGLEQRGGMPLSTPRFERDGIWRGDRSGIDKDVWPAFQPNEVAPAFGAAIESAGFTWLHGRLSYRRVLNTGSSNVTEFQNGLRNSSTYDGTRISSERVGYSLDGSLPNLGGVKGGLVYDLYDKTVSNIYASLDWYTTQKLTLSVDYDFYKPTFEADSIWNFFLAMPMNDLGLRAAWDPTEHLGLAAGVHARIFTLQTGPDPEPDPNLRAPTSPNVAPNYYPGGSLEPTGGGNLSGRWRFGEGSVGARGVADFASNGERLGLDVFGERTLETRYLLQARAGVWQWNDRLRADHDAADFTYVLGAGYRLLPRSRVLADFQHDINPIGGQRFRVMVHLTIALSN